jgi:hypothetical protein
MSEQIRLAARDFEDLLQAGEYFRRMMRLLTVGMAVCHASV